MRLVAGLTPTPARDEPTKIVAMTPWARAVALVRRMTSVIKRSSPTAAGNPAPPQRPAPVMPTIAHCGPFASAHRLAEGDVVPEARGVQSRRLSARKNPTQTNAPVAQTSDPASLT